MESTQNRMGAAPVPKLPHADTLIWDRIPGRACRGARAHAHGGKAAAEIHGITMVSMQKAFSL